MALLGIHAGTYAEYVAKKEASQLVETDLYFTTDAPQKLFRGSNPVNEAWTLVDADPDDASAMRAGVLYINKTTGKISVLGGDDGSTIETIMPARVTSIGASGNDDAIPTVAAIRGYVQSVSSGGFTQAAYVASEAEHVHELKFTTSGGTDTYVKLPSGLANVEYDNATGKFTFTKYDGSKVEADTPLEKILTSAEFDDESHILTLTFATSSGTPQVVPVDLTGLVDTFTVAATPDQAISIASGEGLFTINLKMADASLSQSAAGLKVALSANEGNQLTLQADGLFVAKPADVDLSPYAKLADLASTETSKGASLIGVNGTFAGGATVQTVLTDHETRIGSAEGKVTAIEGRLDTAEGEIDTLQTEMESVTAALTWKAI